MQTNSILEKAKRITENSIQFNQKKKEFETQIPDKELITLKEAIDQYHIPDFGKYMGEPYDNMVLVFKGDVSINENFNHWLERQSEGLYWKTSLTIILIDGNLRVNGKVKMTDFMKLLIKKDLECDVYESFKGFLEVDGNATIHYGVYATDYIGGFSIQRNLSTPYLVSYYGAEIPFNTDIGESIYIRIDTNLLVKNDDFDTEFYEKSESLFKENVWKESDYEPKTFLEIVKKGENPFVDING